MRLLIGTMFTRWLCSHAAVHVELNLSFLRFQQIIAIAFHDNTLICFTQRTCHFSHLSNPMILVVYLDTCQIVSVNMLYSIRSPNQAHFFQLGNSKALNSDSKRSRPILLGMSKRRTTNLLLF